MSNTTDRMNWDGENKSTKSRALAPAKEGIWRKTKDIYRAKTALIAKHCLQTDSHIIALSITSAICIGVIPVFGVTLVFVTFFGLVFRLNQVVVQTVHFLVSPLQVLLFYPFIKAGKWIFGIHDTLGIGIKQVPTYIFSHSGQFFQHYLKIFLAGTAVWLVISVIAGFGIYRYIKWALEKKLNKAFVRIK